MANLEHLSMLRQGVETWNQWRDINPHLIPDLYDADLRNYPLQGANLRRVVLGKTSLSLAHLQGADLFQADLYEADLFRANLQQVNLQQAYLCRANLYRADLRDSQLQQARLGRSDLTKANLQGANLSHTSFTEANLSQANCQDSDFSYAFLKSVRVYGTNFDNANLNGTCLQDLHIDSLTELETAICKYFYRDYDTWDNKFSHRYPTSDQEFLNPGDLAQILRPTEKTLNLNFSEPICFHSLVKSLEHLNKNLPKSHTKSLEQTEHGSLLFRISVTHESDIEPLKQAFWTEYNRLRKSPGRRSQPHPADIFSLLKTLANR
ncbi:pentapeptide repeat-containing protein [Sodalinema gerasimenkoae]|uniref:pentapeptide repeat-containing protein n=1 Tax=Sodalinema gerasimenkoae TaxID=2862348 RepID=UPI001358FA1A|nr:pentapeptide repeat-containing protein [Sodalinema gerasimenkoae]